MLHAILALSLLAGSEIYADNELYPDQIDYVGGSGVSVGLFGLQVCTQDADDVTPGVGVGYGPLGLGCNIIVTSDSNSGATAITTFDGVPPTVPGVPGAILYVIGPATAANPTTIADAGNFELERAWSAAGAGQETRVLLLECVAANTFVEMTRHNGPRYFDGAATFAATIDAESYMSIGDGSALSATDTLIVDRDFSTATTATQQTTTGVITVTGGTSSVSTALVAPEGVILNDGGPGVHPVIASFEVREPIITETVGTCTDSAAVYLSSQATECDNNYALWVVDDVMVEGALTAGSMTMAGDLDMGDNNITNVKSIDINDLYIEGEGICYPAPTSDVAATDVYVHAAHAYAQATGASQTGADLVATGGVGTRQVTIDDFNQCALAEVGVIINQDAVVTLVEGTDWNRGASDAEAATSLAAAIDALTGVASAAIAAVANITPATSTYFVDLTEDTAACTTLTEGNDGIVNLSQRVCFFRPDGVVGPSFATYADAGLRLYTCGTTTFAPLYVGNFVATGTINAYQTSSIGWSTRSLMLSSADGQINFTDSAGTGFTSLTLGPETAANAVRLKISGNTLYLRNGDDSANAALSCGTSYISNAYVVNVIQVGSDDQYLWSDNVSGHSGTPDTGLARDSAGVVRTTDGSTGTGDHIVNDLTCDNPTVGASADSGIYKLSGNHWNDPNNYQSDATMQVMNNAGNPNWRLQIDDDTTAGAGTLTTIITAYDDSVEITGETHFQNNAAAATFGAVGTDADVVLAFDAVTAQGSITYMEDEDRFDFDNDVTIGGELIASGTGPHAIGTTTYDYSQVKIGGAFTSGGADLHAERILIHDTLTGADGDTQRLSTMDVMGAITTQTAAENIALVAQAIFREPQITDQLGGAGAIANAVTVYIEGAPTEGGTRNASLLVDAGAVIFDGTLDVVGVATFDGAAAIVVGTSTPFQDAAGSLTLQQVDVLDATTEGTIEAAIDTLANLTSVQGQAVSLAGAVTVEAGGCTCNQDLTTDASVTFDDITMGDILQMTTIACAGIPAAGTAGRIMFVTDGAELLCCDTGAAWVGCAAQATCCP